VYRSHFGLRELPFTITPDTSFFFACASYQEALNTLLAAVVSGEGFIKITGEVGTGKTLLCRKFLATLGADSGDGRFVTAYIPNPYLEPRTLLLAVADELGIAPEKDIEQHQLLKAVNHRLIELVGEGKQVVLCLDEAQAMPLETLEALRLLTNLETEKRKLLQVVLFGQPELNTKLQHNSVRQLRQRITFHYDLSALVLEELEAYLSHRLMVAGYNGARLFGKGAVKRLHVASRGVPRLVNILAHKSLMLAYGQGVHEVSARHVSDAAADTPSARKIGRWAGWMSAA
jgi:MSHA biogenesis protein MshM